MILYRFYAGILYQGLAIRVQRSRVQRSRGFTKPCRRNPRAEPSGGFLLTGFLLTGILLTGFLLLGGFVRFFQGVSGGLRWF
jgi:hypothetical protein